MKAKLISQWGAEKGAEFEIGAEASIGRGSDNDVRLEGKPVSSQHARIFYDAEARAYFLEDLGSLNGTEIDGTRVSRVERLGRMHVLNFGGVCDLLFVAIETEPAPEPASEPPAAQAEAPVPAGEGTRVDAEVPVLPSALAEGDAAPRGVTQVEKVDVPLPEKLAAPPTEAPAAEAEAPAAEPAPEPEPEPEPAADEAAVEADAAAVEADAAVVEADAAVVEADAAAVDSVADATEFVLAVIEEGTPRRLPLAPGENLIGRSKRADLTLSSPQLSRRHALITVRGERVTVRDLDSRNHTFVEERQVSDEVEVAVRARLRFGLVEAYLLRRGDEDDLTAPRVERDEGDDG